MNQKARNTALATIALTSMLAISACGGHRTPAPDVNATASITASASATQEDVDGPLNITMSESGSLISIQPNQTVTITDLPTGPTIFISSSANDVVDTIQGADGKPGGFTGVKAGSATITIVDTALADQGPSVFVIATYNVLVTTEDIEVNVQAIPTVRAESTETAAPEVTGTEDMTTTPEVASDPADAFTETAPPASTAPATPAPTTPAAVMPSISKIDNFQTATPKAETPKVEKKAKKG